MDALDPVTLEVVRSTLLAITAEMKSVVTRTAYSTLWREAGDLSCAILTTDGDLVAQGEGDIPVHFGTMPTSAKCCIRAIGQEHLQRGDILFSNDPYSGNNHLPDFLMLRPVFIGHRLFAYGAVRGHYVDVGGHSPGSHSVLAHDIYAEGLRIPPIRLVEAGTMKQDIIDILRANTRNSQERLGDLNAQMAGCVTAERRLIELGKRFGPEVALQAMQQILNDTELEMRRAVSAIPDGEYAFTDYLDDDGVSPQPVRIQAVVRVEGDEVNVDFTGSALQVAGAMNCPMAVTLSATYYALKGLATPRSPGNSGTYRPIHVHAPEGTIVNCRPPAPVIAGNTETANRIVDVVLGALAPALPERVPAAGSGSTSSLIIGGIDDRPGSKRREYIYVEPHGSAHGASMSHDGTSGTRVGVGNTGNTPTEAIEIKFPLRVEAYGLVPDSGGAGRTRGGCSIRHRIRILAEEASVIICGERGKIPPYGLFGGEAGMKASVTLDPGTPGERTLPLKTDAVRCRKGTVVEYIAPGSGGYGDPRERDVKLIREDKRDGWTCPGKVESSH